MYKRYDYIILLNYYIITIHLNFLFRESLKKKIIAELSKSHFLKMVRIIVFLRILWKV